MRSIIIGFSKPKTRKIFSEAIMWMEQSNFSHVYIKIDWPSADRQLVYQASGLQVNFESWSYFQTHAHSVAEFNIDITEEVYKKIATYLCDNLNKPYSMKQVYGMFFVCLGKRMNITITNPYKNRHDAFICSEIGADILKEANIDVGTDSEDIGPKELFDFLETNFSEMRIL